MFLLCIGPDTYHAQGKAQDLEKAFRSKHDPSGSSIEIFPSDKNTWNMLMERMNTPSLFSSRRFFRTRDFLAELSRNQIEHFARSLTIDPDGIIVVSVESEPPPAKVFEMFASVPKVIRYEYPLQHGAAFLRSVRTIASELGINDPSSVDRIGENANGDIWLAWNELMKIAAGGKSEFHPTEADSTVFSISDAFLRKSDDLSFLANPAIDHGKLLSSLIGQTRAAIRVRDGAKDGLHPFVVKKMQNTSLSHVEASLAVLIRAMVAQRIGFGNVLETGLFIGAL